MSASDILHPDGADFDSFLFAEVGEDRNGATVTVISALARLGIEPWNEARELAGLGQEEAKARLTAHFETITDIPALALASASRAARLVPLLPKNKPRLVSKPPEKTAEDTTESPRRLPASWLFIALIGILALARILYLAQGG